jgi:membrane-associated phospholipid phosphatase
MLVLAISYFTVTLGVMIFTFHSKVSVHAAGVSGPGTYLLIVYGVVALPVLIIWIAVVWARLTLQQHTIREALTGLCLGILITFITYTMFYTRVYALQ